jgi:hypothetical protein
MIGILGIYIVFVYTRLCGCCLEQKLLSRFAFRFREIVFGRVIDGYLDNRNMKLPYRALHVFSLDLLANTAFDPQNLVTTRCTCQLQRPNSYLL